MAHLPEHLREISGSPEKLFIKGKSLEENFLGIAIVGTRRPTPQGIEIAKSIAEHLAKIGIPVISGLALGIDSAAHAGCLAFGGRTIAVLGNGLDRIYPDQNRGLAEEIIKSGGSVISEYPPGTPPLKHHFLARNRIVAGLSSAVIVIEAPLRSGSLSTAGYAADFGREVLVFPGSAFHRNYQGSHALIRDGARLVTSFEDIAEDLRLNIGNNPVSPSPLPGMDKRSSMILQLIADSQIPLPVDKIASLIKLEPREIAVSLTEMTLDGLITESGEGYSIIKKL